MWWTYMQAVIKDTLYFIVFAWFLHEYIIILLKDHKKNVSARLIQPFCASLI